MGDLSEGLDDARELTGLPGRPSRRGLVKGAIAAGIGAWTAPIIIESLASPAAADSARCFQVFQTVNAGSLVSPTQGWSAGWSDGAGTLTDNGLPCAPGGCTPVTATTSAFRTSIPNPTPNVTWGQAQAVTVSAPSGCRIIGVGVSLQSSNGLFGSPTPQCSTTTTTSAVRFTLNQIGTQSVVITPRGDTGNAASNGFWDTITTGTDGRSSIVLQIQCP